MANVFETIKTCMSSGVQQDEDETKAKYWAKHVSFRTFHNLEDAKRFAKQDGPQLIQIGSTCVPVRDMIMARIINQDLPVKQDPLVQSELEVKFAENPDTAVWLGPYFILRLVIEPKYTEDIMQYFCNPARGHWNPEWTKKPC